MSDQDREPIIKRIMALMAKTTQNGCSEEEAMAAAKKVTELLNKYELNMTDIELKQSETLHEKIDTLRKSADYMASIVTGIGYLTDCKVWVVPGEGAFKSRVYHFLGLEHDVIVAKYIYSICDRAVTFAWEDRKDEIDFRNMAASQKGKAKDNFQLGMAHRLYRRLRDMKDAQKRENMESTGRDLVVVKDAIVTEAFAKLGLHLRKGGPGKRVTADSNYYAGVAAGNRVNLNKGIGGNQARESLS